MAKLTASRRASLPKKDFAVPSKAPGPGSYPMPDKAHAGIAKGLAAMHGSKSEATVDRKANKVLKRGGGGLSEAQDAKYDRAHGIKENSARDKRQDRKMGVKQGGGGTMSRTGASGGSPTPKTKFPPARPSGSKSPNGGAKAPRSGGSKGPGGRAIQGPRGGGGKRY